jgi:hypothetical protein
MLTLFAASDKAFWENGQLVFWGAIVLICCVPSISYYLYKWRKTELETELKRDMIARGMSAEEIERVLGAKLSPGDEKSPGETKQQFNVTQTYHNS